MTGFVAAHRVWAARAPDRLLLVADAPARGATLGWLSLREEGGSRVALARSSRAVAPSSQLRDALLLLDG